MIPRRPLFVKGAALLFLSKTGIIICESAVGDRFAHGFETVRERRYGATMITVLRLRDGGTDEGNENCDLSGQF